LYYIVIEVSSIADINEVY